MDKAIVTVLMIVAGVVAAVLVFNAVYPAIVQSNGALVSMGARLDERLGSEIAVIHATKSGENPDVAFVWIKNIGITSIKAIERCDVFFGPEGGYQLIPYGSGEPHWEYVVENDEFWRPGATLRITIDYNAVLAEGERYFFKMTVPNGVSDEYYFSPSR